MFDILSLDLNSRKIVVGLGAAAGVFVQAMTGMDFSTGALVAFLAPLAGFILAEAAGDIATAANGKAALKLLKNKWGSKKLKVAVLASVIVFLSEALGWDLSGETLAGFVTPALAYIGGQGALDVVKRYKGK